MTESRDAHPPVDGAGERPNPALEPAPIEHPRIRENRDKGRILAVVDRYERGNLVAASAVVAIGLLFCAYCLVLATSVVDRAPLAIIPTDLLIVAMVGTLVLIARNTLPQLGKSATVTIALDRQHCSVTYTPTARRPYAFSLVNRSVPIKRLQRFYVGEGWRPNGPAAIRVKRLYFETDQEIVWIRFGTAIDEKTIAALADRLNYFRKIFQEPGPYRDR